MSLVLNPPTTYLTGDVHLAPVGEGLATGVGKTSLVLWRPLRHVWTPARLPLPSMAVEEVLNFLVNNKLALHRLENLAFD